MNRRHVSQRQTKIDWLLAHQLLWGGWPDGRQADPRHRSIVEAMKADGLVSHTTYPPDVALDTLITEARRQRREANEPTRL